MKKRLIYILIACLLPISAAKAQTPSYDALSDEARSALNDRDYEKAYALYRTMDSVYGIEDFADLLYLTWMTHDKMPNSETAKNMLFRVARNKCCDMLYLDRMAEHQQYDTLDYWDDIVALVAPRGYQDTLYQNRLLAMMRADRDIRNSRWLGSDTAWRSVFAVDSTNLVELKRLIAERGFPTYTKVGCLCVRHASWVVQHQPAEFQQWYLERARAAADTGDYDAQWIAEVESHKIAQKDYAICYDTLFLNRLLQMSQTDQEVRLLPENETNRDSVWRAINEVDSVNLIELKRLIADRGFPTLSSKGFYCCYFASQIAQHAPPEYLHEFLLQAQAAADSGDFDATWLALMTDRDRDYRGLPQLYGTQALTKDGFKALYPIEEVEHLAERRKSVRLQPIEEYLPLLGIEDFCIHPSFVDYNQYSLHLRIEGDTLRVSGFVLFPYVSVTNDSLSAYVPQALPSEGLPGYTSSRDLPFMERFSYSLPLADYRTADGAIVLRRESQWYPHRTGELLTAKVHIEAGDYYILGGDELLPSFDLHLVLLPKEKYDLKEVEGATRPFHFYRAISDTTHYPDAYYNEFLDAYNYYCTFFGDSLSSRPMNVVEIGDPQFVMCQSLRDMIIMGHYFYQVYTMIPDFSWIPHEVAHQWWGNSLFFEHRDYALSESITEYIKLQFLKRRGRGYREQKDYYKTMMERAEKQLPIATIHSVESQDESVAIYHSAPYRLDRMNARKVNDILRQLYRERRHTIVSRPVFMQQCEYLQGWLNN